MSKKPAPRRRQGRGPRQPSASAAANPSTPARSPAQRPADRRHQGKAEEMFHGVRACEALFARRPEAIVRVYVSESRRRQFAKLLEWCARERKGFQVVGDENLQKLTGSIHHEGVAILARAVPRRTLDDLLRSTASAAAAGPLLYLDGVQNPHNLGSILRTAAHFGVAAILGRGGELPPLSPAAVRVAEGAAEFVPVCDLTDPAVDLGRLKREGFRIVATSSHRGGPLDAARLDAKSIIVLGAEGEGVSRPIERLADACVQIQGTGAVESLNVSVACGILLAAVRRAAR